VRVGGAAAMCPEGVPTNRGGCMERRGRVGRVMRVMGCKKHCWNKRTAESLNGDGEGMFPPLRATVHGMRVRSVTCS
jgi:hypothetical protein